MRSIYLIGFMGSGKSSVAKELSNKLNFPVLDTDQLIEEKYKKTIPTIFANDGESTFRTLESEVLQSTPVIDHIVATGGGIVEKEENIKWLKQNGIVVYLHTSWHEIVNRLKNDQSRPIWNNDQVDKQMLLQKRLNKYKTTATFEVITDEKLTSLIAEEIITIIYRDNLDKL